jgi:outer membrane immunogenic protein
MSKVLGILLSATALVAFGLSATSAEAADLVAPAPVYKAPPAYVPPFSWTGFYIGGNVGVGWSQGNVTDDFFGLNLTNSNNASFLGGGQVGGNYQIGQFVIGAEADFDWLANNQNSGTTVSVGGTTLQVNSNDRWITTVAGRLGYAFDHVLIYGKGGGGWVGNNNFTVTNVPTGASFSLANDSTNSGWLAGGGVEWAFAPNWTVRAEYDFLGLSNRSFTLPATFPVAALAGDTFTTHDRDVQMFTVGVNYLFNWPGL